MEASEKALRSHRHLQMPACSEGVNPGDNKGKLLPSFHWLKKDECSGCPKPHNNPQQRQMCCQGRELAVNETEGFLQSQTHPLAAPGCHGCRPVGTVGVSEHFWSPTSAVTAAASGRESVPLPPMRGRPGADPPPGLRRTRWVMPTRPFACPGGPGLTRPPETEMPRQSQEFSS